MTPCPKCGTSMDFIGRHNQWYCPECKEFNPPHYNQYPLQPSQPNKTNKNLILATMVIIIIIISVSLGYLLLDSADGFTIEIESVNLVPDDRDFTFELTYSFSNPSGEDKTINWVIQLIENGSIQSSSEFSEIISENKGSRSQIRPVAFDSNNRVLEKYHVKVYWKDKLMDSIEKDF